MRLNETVAKSVTRKKNFYLQSKHPIILALPKTVTVTEILLSDISN